MSGRPTPSEVEFDLLAGEYQTANRVSREYARQVMSSRKPELFSKMTEELMGLGALFQRPTPSEKQFLEEVEAYERTTGETPERARSFTAKQNRQLYERMVDEIRTSETNNRTVLGLPPI